MKIYINGSQHGSNVAKTGNINTTTADTVIGLRTTSSDRGFEGQIDEVKIYNRALTSTEIAKNYKHGLSKHS